jgi:hypothetical protein
MWQTIRKILQVAINVMVLVKPANPVAAVMQVQIQIRVAIVVRVGVVTVVVVGQVQMVFVIAAVAAGAGWWRTCHPVMYVTPEI